MSGQLHHISSEVCELIEPVLNQMAYELVGVEYAHNGRYAVLRVYIDKPEGITLDDCTRVSHQLSGLLDVETNISGAYDLEVSSPGLDRPLFKLTDFERFAGHMANIRLSLPQNGRRNFKGIIKGVEGKVVLMQVEKSEYSLLFDHIEKARLVPDI